MLKLVGFIVVTILVVRGITALINDYNTKCKK